MYIVQLYKEDWVIFRMLGCQACSPEQYFQLSSTNIAQTVVEFATLSIRIINQLHASQLAIPLINLLNVLQLLFTCISDLNRDGSNKEYTVKMLF